MDEVVEQVENAKKEWEDTYNKAQENINSIQDFGKSRTEKSASSLPRLNALAQDELGLLNSLIFKLDLLAPQLPLNDQVESAVSLLKSWKNQIQRYHLYDFLDGFLCVLCLIVCVCLFVCVYIRCFGS